MEACVFCKIIKGEIPSRKEYEDEELVVFHDIRPGAPVHLLLVPKKHIELTDDLDVEVSLGKIFGVAKSVAGRAGVFKSGYKLVMNCGEGAGQAVDHLHVHLIGGWKTGEVRKLP